MTFRKNTFNKKPRRIHRNKGARLKTPKLPAKFIK